MEPSSQSVPHCAVQLALSDDVLDDVHARALQVLERTGLAIPDPESLTLLGSAGCRVDQGQSRAYFPPALMEEYLAQVPTEIALGGRTPDDDLILTQSTLFVRPQSGCPNVVDLRTGEVRAAMLADVVAMARLNEMLPHIHLVASLIYPEDVPIGQRDVAVLSALLQSSRKHVYVQPYEPAGAARMIEMAEVLRRDMVEVARRPPFTFIIGPTSPLTVARNEAAVIRLAAEKGIPVAHCSTPQRGATGPVTLAGQLLLQHVENLGTMVLAQVTQPGAPVTYGIRPSTFDMRTMNSLWGNVEWSMGTAAALQLARRHGFITDVVGIPTDSKVSDAQAGLEKGFNAAIASLFGGNIVAGAGFLDSIMTGSFEQMVIDDDVAGMMLRARRGMEIDDDRLAGDVIARVGPGGSFLAEYHTLRYMREETFFPAVLNSQIRADWDRGGSMDVVQVARERARELIDAWDRASLPGETITELERLVGAQAQGAPAERR